MLRPKPPQNSFYGSYLYDRKFLKTTCSGGSFICCKDLTSGITIEGRSLLHIQKEHILTSSSLFRYFNMPALVVRGFECQGPQTS